MDGWVYIALSSIILFLLFPFKITGMVEFISRDLSLTLAVYLFTYNVIDTTYFIEDGVIVQKPRFSRPKDFNLDLGKRGAKRASIALLPERIKLDLLLFSEDNVYLKAGIAQVVFAEIKRLIASKDVRLDFSVIPMCSPASVSVFGKCVFRTSLLRVFASFISCTLKDVTSA